MTTEFTVGDRVRLVSSPPYFKTADSMPMLRPADTLPVGAEGIVQSRRPGGYWGIKFDKGAFLVDSQYIESTEAPADQATGASADSDSIEAS
ncbi:DUF3148 domain-containing protein [Nodosilinea sp. LEGE 07298]|uniref:regulatory protein SipA n=1 Tax=Nodosilinea sp. LEGE 07298 TaxID=2777970 RepID=UPI00187E8426|nr:DUF3148 domain-containing protein [Nodosilinea sp. LEGE 07298]MBE9113107.1 DUF3148 domain-containing protein [Nodosilinea sp. LEGE 07298]